MPKIGVTKVTKSFTISISHLAWLEEYCIRKAKKMSAVIDELINEKRRQLDRQPATRYWCTSCGEDTKREPIDNKPACVICHKIDEALLHAMKIYQS